jgi:Na+-translocating ferredoxin:NAD+ oxidoreductase RnfE subunit
LLVALNSLVVSLVGAAFAARIAQMPQWTMACLLLCSASPLVYSRSQAFAHGTSVGRALFDAAGAGAGLVAALCAIAALRELAGLGTLGNYAVFSRAPWPLMGTAFGGFALSGLFIVAFRRLMPEPQA